MVKRLDEFYKANGGTFGLTSKCKQCIKIWNIANTAKISARKSLNYEKNRERILAANKEYRTSNKEKLKMHRQTATYKAKKKIWDARYFDAHMAQISLKNSMYAKANKEKDRKWKREWKLRNREQARAIDAKYRAGHREERRLYNISYFAAHPGLRSSILNNYKARKLDAFIEAVSSEVVYERDMGLCGICGLSVEIGEFHLDHRIPLSRGGQHSYENCQTAHSHCNVRKSSKLPENCGHLWMRS